MPGLPPLVHPHCCWQVVGILVVECRSFLVGGCKEKVFATIPDCENMVFQGQPYTQTKGSPEQESTSLDGSLNWPNRDVVCLFLELSEAGIVVRLFTPSI